MLAYSFNPLCQVSMLNLLGIYIYIWLTALPLPKNWIEHPVPGVERDKRWNNQLIQDSKPVPSSQKASQPEEQHWGLHRIERLLNRGAGKSCGWRCCTSRRSLSVRPSFDLFRCNIAKIWKELEEGVRKSFLVCIRTILIWTDLNWTKNVKNKNKYQHFRSKQSK